MSVGIIDARNTVQQHLAVGGISLALVLLMNSWMGTSLSTAFARISFILLFTVLALGPIIKLKSPGKSPNPLMRPWSWRGELGIWFTITSIAHFLFVMNTRWLNWSIMKALGGGVGGGGLGLANLMGLIALLMSVALAATSFNKAIRALGVESWKWLQRFAHVIWYLVFGHVMYFQFFSTRATPDLFGYASIVMVAALVLLQSAGFIKTLQEQKK